MEAVSTASGDRSTLPARTLARMRRSRRHPRPTQFDYLHLKRLLEDLSEAISSVEGPVTDALDVFCGTQPYRDLYPEGARVVGWDIDDFYGTCDVAGGEFLPFGDAEFDLVTCIEGFHYVEDSAQGAAELWRVTRPGGTLIVTVPLVWEYDRTILEHRWTGPELARIFRGWDDVEVIENGGWAVAWATLTGRLLGLAGSAAPRPLRPILRPFFALGLLLINGAASVADRLLRRFVHDKMTLPMNLLLRARRPPDQRSARSGNAAATSAGGS